MKFTGFKIPKNIFMIMEQQERIYFIQFGEFLNEINILYRCFIATANLFGDTEVEQSLEISAFLFHEIIGE